MAEADDTALVKSRQEGVICTANEGERLLDSGCRRHCCRSSAQSDKAKQDGTDVQDKSQTECTGQTQERSKVNATTLSRERKK